MTEAHLKSSFATAVLVHGIVLLLFSFTFSSPQIPSKPAFVFLGSFLRQQDVMLPSVARAEANASLNIRDITLDAKSSAWPGNVKKPSLAQKAVGQDKSQFKPVVTEPLVPSDKKNGDDLDLEFGPLPPVKMKINAK